MTLSQISAVRQSLHWDNVEVKGKGTLCEEGFCLRPWTGRNASFLRRGDLFDVKTTSYFPLWKWGKGRSGNMHSLYFDVRLGCVTVRTIYWVVPVSMSNGWTPGTHVPDLGIYSTCNSYDVSTTSFMPSWFFTLTPLHFTFMLLGT